MVWASGLTAVAALTRRRGAGSVALFIACAIAKLSIVESTKYMAPYLVILFLGLVVITYIPWFTLVLPRLFLQ